MSLKENNEITVKIKIELNKFCKLLENKGFTINRKFSMDDTFFIPENLKLNTMISREILSKAILVRDIKVETKNIICKKITFKKKQFDNEGNIIRQESINCDILKTEDAKKLLREIGYKEIMNIKEDDIVYEKDGFQIAIKDIKDGDNLIEIETTEDEKLDTIEKIKQKVIEEELPVYTDNWFVKKAEIELNKILNRV